MDRTGREEAQDGGWNLDGGDNTKADTYDGMSTRAVQRMIRGEIHPVQLTVDRIKIRGRQGRKGSESRTESHDAGGQETTMMTKCR